MLSERYTEDLEHVLVPQEAFRPFPTAAERDAWDALPAGLRQGHVILAEQYLHHEWPSLPATLFMEFTRTGNRSHYEGRSFERRNILTALVIGECIEGQGRFLDDIINGIWAICEESYWGVPATNYLSGSETEPLPDKENNVIDLFAGETAGLLAWTHYLLRSQLDALSERISRRIRYEIRTRILDPFLTREDFWWMGFLPNRSVNNWNPWCNSNCLTAILLLEGDPQRRRQAVAKAMRSIDRFIHSYHPDGGCDEGSTYWTRAGGSLFDCLELLYAASNGRISLYDEPLIQEIGRFVYRVHISDSYYINFADGGAKVHMPGALIYNYGRRIGDAALAEFGASLHRASRNDPPVVTGPMPRVLPELFSWSEMDTAPAAEPNVRDVWLKDIQVMVARENGGSHSGLYLAAKGGHNAESHNHNDVGNFIVYVDGLPCLVDVGVETYSAKTFSRRRYEIWTMQSAYHNVPRVNGTDQQAGLRFRAHKVSYDVSDSRAELSVDIASAYPESSGIVSWHRTLRLHRGSTPGIEVVEDFTLSQPSDDIALVLMTPASLHTGPGEAILAMAGRLVQITFDAARLAPHSETVTITDQRLRSVWGDHLCRLMLKTQAPTQRDTWRLRIMCHRAG